jgi:hypothetical protein
LVLKGFRCIQGHRNSHCQRGRPCESKNKTSSGSGDIHAILLSSILDYKHPVRASTTSKNGFKFVSYERSAESSNKLSCWPAFDCQHLPMAADAARDSSRNSSVLFDSQDVFIIVLFLLAKVHIKSRTNNLFIRISSTNGLFEW